MNVFGFAAGIVVRCRAGDRGVERDLMIARRRLD
jgi:hypothetical protein